MFIFVFDNVDLYLKHVFLKSRKNLESPNISVANRKGLLCSHISGYQNHLYSASITFIKLTIKTHLYISSWLQ